MREQIARIGGSLTIESMPNGGTVLKGAPKAFRKMPEGLQS